MTTPLATPAQSAPYLGLPALAQFVVPSESGRPPVHRPRHVRANARLWAFVILPRVRVHLSLYLLHLLSR